MIPIKESNVAEKLIAALDEALRDSGPLPREIPATLFRSVAARSPKPLATPGDLKTLRQLQDDWQRCWNSANLEHTPANARKRFFEQQNDLGHKISAGEAMDKSEGWTLADWLEDHGEKMASAKGQCLNIARQAREITRPIVARYCELAKQVAAEVEAAERPAFAEFGLAYQPSPLPGLIRASARDAANRIASPPYWTNAPAHALEFLAL